MTITANDIRTAVSLAMFLLGLMAVYGWVDCEKGKRK